jgi:hypothetical protein
MAFDLLKNCILDEIIGAKVSACPVTKTFVADIKSHSPENLFELFDVITATRRPQASSVLGGL